VGRVARWFVFKPKIPIWKNFSGLGLEKVDIFYGRLEHFMDIWDLLCPFDTLCVHLEHFFLFWYHAPRKIWQDCS
jgi:hypothetical protein